MHITKITATTKHISTQSVLCDFFSQYIYDQLLHLKLKTYNHNITFVARVYVSAFVHEVF